MNRKIAKDSHIPQENKEGRNAKMQVPQFFLSLSLKNNIELD